MQFNSYVYSKQPGFVEPEMRQVFKQAVPVLRVPNHSPVTDKR
jgi:hypothetical protein